MKPKQKPRKVPLRVEIDEKLLAAVKAAAEKNRRSVPGEVMIALERHLIALKMWPGEDDHLNR